MAIMFSCSTCGARLQVADELLGQIVRCEGCQQTTVAVPPQTAFSDRPQTVPALGPTDVTPGLQPLQPVGFELPSDKPGKWIWLALGGGTLAMLLAIGGLLYWVLRPSPGLDDIERFAPDQCQMVVVVNGRAILDSEVWLELNKQLPEAMASLRRLEQREGELIPNTELERGYVFASMQDMTNGPLVVLRATKDVDLDQVIERLKVVDMAAETVAGKNGYTYGREVSGQRVQRLLCQVDERTVLEGSPATVRGVLERSGPAQLSAGLSGALQRLDHQHAMTMLVDIKAMSQLGLAAAEGPAAYFQKVHVFTLDMDLTRGLRLTGALKCDSDKTAEELRSMAAGTVAMLKIALPPETPKAVGEMLQKLNFDAKGPLVSGRLELSTETVVAAMRSVEKEIKQIEKQFRFNVAPQPVRPVRPVVPVVPEPEPLPERQSPAVEQRKLAFKTPGAPLRNTFVPPKLGQEPQEIKLPGKVTDVCVAGGGKYLVLHIPEKNTLALFDVAALRVIRQLDVGKARILFAGGMRYVMLIEPEQQRIKRLTLPTLAVDKSATYEMKVPAVAAVMGSSSIGTLVVSGVDWPRLGETMLFDTWNMKRIELPISPHDIFHTSPDVQLRASPNGRVFSCQSRQATQLGIMKQDLLHLYTWNGPTPVLPGARELFTPHQLYSPKLEPLGGKLGDAQHRYWHVPDVEGTDYLILRQVKRLGVSKLQVIWHTLGQPSENTLGIFEEADGLVDFVTGHTQPLDKHFFLIRRAQVLVTLPRAGDRLVLRRLPGRAPNQ